MANRFIKSSIWTSPNLNSLPEGAELMFYRLLPLPDDYGCFVADPRVLKGIIYPLKPISPDIICDHLISLTKVGIISLWSEGDRIYGVFINWSKHQQIRAKFKRKTPKPPQDVTLFNNYETVKLLRDTAISCYQLISSDTPLPSSLLPLPSSLPTSPINSAPTPSAPARLSEKPKGKKDSKQQSQEMMFLTDFGKLFKTRFGTTYIANFSKDVPLVKGMLSAIEYDDLLNRAGQFLRDEDDFIKKAGYTVGTFRSKVNKYVTKKPTEVKGYQPERLTPEQEQAAEIARQDAMKKLREQGVLR